MTPAPSGQCAAILQLLDASNARADAAPLSGRWHYGNGILCCGTLRIAALSIDTNPADSFKVELINWMCDRLNERTELPRANEAIRVLMNCADHCATNPLYTRENCAEHARKAITRALAILTSGVNGLDAGVSD